MKRYNSKHAVDFLNGRYKVKQFSISKIRNKTIVNIGLFLFLVLLMIGYVQASERRCQDRFDCFDVEDGCTETFLQAQRSEDENARTQKQEYENENSQESFDVVFSQ